MQNEELSDEVTQSHPKATSEPPQSLLVAN